MEVSYTSCLYPRLSGDERSAIIVSAVPPDGLRGGGAIAVEGDRWVVTLGGVLGEHAPTDVDGFVDYAATLAIPDIHEMIRDRRPLSDPVLMRYPTSRRRRYDRVERFPERLVVMGDALCSLNPVYGQGMSVAATEAQALGDGLDAGIDGIGPRFFSAVGRVVGDAWQMAASGDAHYVNDGDGGSSLPLRLLGGYQRRLLDVATRDPQVSRAFREVMAMLARPPALLRPSVAVRVFTGSRRSRGRNGGHVGAVTATPGPTDAVLHSAHDDG